MAEAGGRGEGRHDLRVTVLMAVRNRCRQTEACLDTLLAQAGDDVCVQVAVLDDASTDGTGQMLAGRRGVTVLAGSGSCYWGGGMRAAESAAWAHDPDYLLWLNDDAVLAPDALRRALSTARDHPGAIVCGALCDPVSGATTYSGVRRVARPFVVLRPVHPDPLRALPVDTFNGNLVLVPARVARRLRGIDPRFRHHYGDFDYGLRATRAGCRVLLLPGFVGTTPRNGVRGTFRDASLPRAARLAAYVGPKGYPPAERWAFLRRHAGPLAPVQFLAANAGHLGRILVGR